MNIHKERRVGCLTHRVLLALPATVSELAALEDRSVRQMNSILCYLRNRGMVRITDKYGMRYQIRGPLPRLWERA